MTRSVIEGLLNHLPDKNKPYPLSFDTGKADFLGHVSLGFSFWLTTVFRKEKPYTRQRRRRRREQSVSYPQVGHQLLTLHLSPLENGHVLGVPWGPVMEKQCSSDCSLLLEFIQKKLHLEVYTNQSIYNQHIPRGQVPVLAT